MRCNNILVMLSLIGILAISGCDSTSGVIPQNTSTQAAIKVENTYDIYTIDSENARVIPLAVKLNTQKATAKDIAHAVADNLDEKVQLNAVTSSSDRVVVSFKNGKAPQSGCSSKVEEMILECFANSILDNIDSCKEIIFQGEKGAYESGHLEFGEDEVFASK